MYPRAHPKDDKYYKQFLEMLEDCLPPEKAGECLNNEAFLVDWFRRYVWKDVPLEGAPEDKPAKATKPKKAAVKKKQAKVSKKNEPSPAPEAEKVSLGLQVEDGLPEEEVAEVVSGRLDDAVEAMLQRCMESA